MFNQRAEAYSMKYLLIAFLFLTGCGSAQLVSSRYKPKKMGTVRLDIPGPAQRSTVQAQANEIMRKFCAPKEYEIVGTDSENRVDGAYANQWGTSYQQSTLPLVHFECVD